MISAIANLLPFTYTAAPKEPEPRPEPQAPNPRLTALVHRSIPLEPLDANADVQVLLRNLGQKIHEYQLPIETKRTIDWRAETNRQIEDVIYKLSLIATLSMMDPHLDGNLSAEILRETCQSKRSLCEIYLEKINPGFFASLKVRLTWFFYYQCSIIPNIIDGGAKSILQKLRSELVQKEGGKNLTSLIEILLKDFNAFLADRLKALREYAEGQGEGSPDDHVAMKLQKDVEGISKEFGDVMVNELLPENISFFRAGKESPWFLVRCLTKIFASYPEKLLNNFLRAEMRRQIPELAKSLIATSREAAQKKNLPFSIAITEGILGQLDKFKTELHQAKGEAAPPPAPRGTDKLPEVVTHLLEVLRLEPYKTRDELKQQLNKKSLFTIPGLDINKHLQDGLVDGCRTFFSHLSDPDNAEELFAQLLYLTNLQLTSKAPSSRRDWLNLETRYNQLQKEMHREAGEIFQSVVRKTVTRKIEGWSDEEKKLMAVSFCSEMRVRLSDTAAHFDKSLSALRGKLQEMELEEETPLPTGGDLQDDLDAIAESLASCRTQLLSGMEDLEQFPAEAESFRAGIKSTLKPIILHLDSLPLRRQQARELGTLLAQDSALAEKLRSVRKRLDTFKREEGSTLFENEELEELQARGEEAGQDTAPLRVHLQEMQQSCSQLEEETHIVEDLYELGKADGLLKEYWALMEKAIRGETTAIKRRALRAEIVSYCKHLPAHERKAILALVDTLSPSTPLKELGERWNATKQTVRQFYSAHAAEETLYKEVIASQYEKAKVWTKKLLEQSSEAAKTWRVQLMDAVEKMEQESLAPFRQAISGVQPIQISSHYTQIEEAAGGPFGFIGGLLGLGAGAAAAYWLDPSYALPMAGATVGAIRAMNTQNSTLFSCVSQSALGAAVGLAGNYAIGPLETLWEKVPIEWLASWTSAADKTPIDWLAASLPALAMGAAGTKAPKAAATVYGDRVVYPKVMETFNHLYSFILKKDVWSWMVIDAIDAINGAHRKT